jgi:dihydropteroate synthase
MSERILFLTGKLAERSLHRVLESMQPAGFEYEVRNIGLTVAALMTSGMIVRRVESPGGAERVVVPGLCRGDLGEAEAVLGVPVLRGPNDLKDLPAFFGREGAALDLRRHDVRIFAEIVDAPSLSIEHLLAKAQRYAADGADVIDLGCLPDTKFPHLEDAVRALAEAGFRVSVDSVAPDELLRAGRAGADYLLSLSEETLWIAGEVESVPVLIPRAQGDMESLYRTIDGMRAAGRAFIADSVLDPIHFGFTESLLRYAALRRRYPDIEIMMGIGNLTELTEADTTGIQAILFGIISELGITSVLTTQVSPHARSVVREADLARRIMFAARAEDRLPKGLDGGLLAIHDRKPFPYSQAEVAELAAQIRDPSYRVQVTEEGISVFNRDGIISGLDPFQLFARLEALQADAPHAFYMGVELAKARIAWLLGKRYVQDEELCWGVAAPAREEDGCLAGRDAHAYKPAGSTLKASRKAKKRRKK